MAHLRTIPTFGCANFIPIDYSITRTDRGGRGGTSGRQSKTIESELVSIQHYIQVRWMVMSVSIVFLTVSPVHLVEANHCAVSGKGSLTRTAFELTLVVVVVVTNK